MWVQKFIILRQDLKTIKMQRLLGIISKSVDDKIVVICKLIPELFKKAGFCHFNNFSICLCLRFLIFANNENKYLVETNCQTPPFPFLFS